VSAVDPLHDKAWNNISLSMFSLGRHDEAIAAVETALAVNPNCAEAYCNFGLVLHAQNNNDRALDYYNRALSLDPSMVNARLNSGLIELASGDFALGWPKYELRWETASFRKRESLKPQWCGQPLHGATILLHAEQGLGDTIQSLRSIPLVEAAGGRVVLEVPKRLRRLAAEVPGVAELLSAGESLPPFDFHCPLQSLPLAFGTTLETIPAEVPYLLVPEEARKKLEGIPWPTRGLRVGVVWAGKPTFFNDRFRYRSIPLSLLEPLFRLDNVQLFSLQVGDAAAQITHLDLVISVDTSVAHLTGALGIPTFVLLPFTPDRRWMHKREDSPWYPTMRLFRQPEPGVWEPVIDKVCGALTRQSLQFAPECTARIDPELSGVLSH
jgi:hypothetical protein